MRVHLDPGRLGPAHAPHNEHHNRDSRGDGQDQRRRRPRRPSASTTVRPKTPTTMPHQRAIPAASRRFLRTASDRPTACATTTASGAGAALRSQRLSVAAGGRAGFSRSGQVAVVERVSCWCCGAACVRAGGIGWPVRRCMGIPQGRVSHGPLVRAGGIGWPVRRSVGCHGTPKSTCRHEMRQIQLDAYVSNRGEPVKRDPGTAYVRGCRCSDCRECQRVGMAESRH